MYIRSLRTHATEMRHTAGALALFLALLVAAILPGFALADNRSSHRADLTIAAVGSPPPGSAHPLGSTLTLNATAENIGLDDATNTSVLFAYREQANASNVISISSVSTGLIAAAANKSAQVTWNTSGVAGLVLGNLSLGFGTTSDVDTNTANNWTWLTVVLQASDVEIASVTPGASSGFIGDSIAVTARVENRGNLVATGVLVRFFIDNASMDSWNTTVNISAGGNVSLVFPWDTSGLLPGNHTVLVTAPGSAPVRSANVTLVARMAQVNIQSITVEFTTATVGAILLVNATLNNTGTANATGIIVEFSIDNSTVAAWNVTVNVTMGGLTVVNFPWNTSGLSAGNHTVTVWQAGRNATTPNVTLTLPPPPPPSYGISFASPANNTEVNSSSLPVTFTVAGGFVLDGARIGQANLPGVGHWHLFLDGAYVAAGASLTPTLTGLSPGTHTLRVALHNNNHSELAGAASDQIVVTVAATAPGIFFETPADGATVNSSSLTVTVRIRNFTINATAVNGTNAHGEGHWHFSLDGDAPRPETGPTVELTRLPSGTHTITAELVQNNHSSLSPSVWDTRSFTVAAGRPGLNITSPTAGQQFQATAATAPLPVTITVENFALNATMMGNATNTAGQGHWHAAIDGTRVLMGDSESFTIPGVAPGIHSLTVSLANNDHSALADPVAESVRFTVLPAPVPTTGTIAITVIADDTKLPVEASIETTPATGTLTTSGGKLSLTLAPGSYTLKATPVNTSYDPTPVAPIEVVAGQTINLTISVKKHVTPPTTISLNFPPVYDRNGKPVKGAEVQVTCSSEVFKSVAPHTDAAGRAQIPGVKRDCLNKSLNYRVSHVQYKVKTGQVEFDVNGNPKGSVTKLTLEAATPDPALVVVVIIVALIAIAAALALRRPAADEAAEEEGAPDEEPSAGDEDVEEEEDAEDDDADDDGDEE